MSHPPNDNPWQDEASQTGRERDQYQGQSYQNHNSYSTFQDDPQHPAHRQDPYTHDASHTQYQPPDHPPPHQQPLSSNPPPQQQRYYEGGNHEAAGMPPSFSSHDQNPWQPQHQAGGEVPPSLPPRRSGTDLALPTGQDRSHQIEVMQSYEAAGRKDEHDQNVETLQREFPGIDGSLIAAIYGDSKSLSATREMLGELDTQ